MCIIGKKKKKNAFTKLADHKLSRLVVTLGFVNVSNSRASCFTKSSEQK